MFILLGHLVLAWIAVELEPPLGRFPALDQLRIEPAVALALLGTIAASVMTVVSVVYSILLVALSLASMQFSTRVVSGYVRDPLSQTVAGVFVGTFVYCLVVMMQIRTEDARAPVVAIGVALLLTMSCLALLLTFIQHITRSIRANTLVDRIADETREVIVSVFVERPNAKREIVEIDHGGAAVRAGDSGYLQLLDVEGVRSLAKGRVIQLTRSMGSFVPRGAVLFRVSGELSSDDREALLHRVDLGPERTLQDDAEYGIRQLVDVALKAISPAVNDPSTAVTCIDQLGALLILAGGLPDPPNVFPAEADGRFELLRTSFDDLVDLSIEQIRQYGKGDMAVCLRLLRTLADVREVTPLPRGAKSIEKQLGFIERSARKVFADEDCEELERRIARARLVCRGSSERAS